MKDERLDDLIDQHLNGAMNEEDRRELEERLLHSAADRARFWALAETHVLVHEGVQQQLAALAIKPSAAEHPAMRHRQPHSRWFQWRPLTAAAAGVMFGMFCTSMVWAYVGPYTGKAVTLLREGFESSAAQTLPGLPRATGVWSGDEARVVAADGVQPKDGRKMLRFMSATFAGENAKLSAWGDVYRLVDLRGQVGDAKSSVRLSASFDATQFASGEAYLCSLELCALETDLTDAPQPLTLPWVRESSASSALRKFPLMGDGVWREMAVEVPVSAQTRYVLVHLAVMRTKPFPPATPVQFSGHYLDDVKLELRTQPNARD
jgi:hypothetical protein